MKRSLLFVLLFGFLLSTFLTPNAFAQQGRPAVQQAQRPTGRTVVFQRVTERNEGAFSVLMPKTWIAQGGIIRVDPNAQGGPAQSIAAKVDFALLKDRAGSVMIRWYPDVLFMDPRTMPAARMGMFPPGSNYQGMTVWPLSPAVQFLGQGLFPRIRPGAANVRILEQRPLPQAARMMQERTRALMPNLTFSYDMGLLRVQYDEAGMRYEELLVGTIENWGQLGAGMWGNKETFSFRAPAGQLAAWIPVFSIVQESVQISPQWLAGEIRGQIERGQIAAKTQQEVQRIEQAIVEHRQRTNAEIHHDVFLTLTQQEEYVNPYNGRVEVGSNQWKHRWINGGGEVVYTDDPSYDPNADVDLNRSDYKKTPVRKRFPQ